MKSAYRLAKRRDAQSGGVIVDATVDGKLRVFNKVNGEVVLKRSRLPGA
jgi:hypothetical protein